MPKYYMLTNPAGVYVKESSWFDEQGGPTQNWGLAWRPIEAESLDAARALGIMARRFLYPDSHLTAGELGEDREPTRTGLT